jgi:alcohol dehydrogenase (cytochrome c)
VLAIRPKTGELVCYFQYTPNDVYDVDATDEQVLADMRVNGQMRKVMIQTNKNGFLYVLDRTNCKLIAAHPYTKVNWASGIDMKTGRPVLTDVYKRFTAGEEVEIYPSRGSNAVPAAFNPNTGLIFANTWNVPRLQKLAPKPVEHGGQSTGVEARQPETKPDDVLGSFAAIDPLTGVKKWEVPLKGLPSSAGMLATGGGLVFTGKLTGEFIALDQDTGQQLWQFQTGSSVNATAITYMHKGRQYVTIASGLGGVLATRYASKIMPTGGSLWTFAVMQ